MATTRRYRLPAEAQRDLDEIVDYLLADSVDAAERVVRRLDFAFSRVAHAPGIGHRREDLTDALVRLHAVFSWSSTHAWLRVAVRPRHGGD